MASVLVRWQKFHFGLVRLIDPLPRNKINSRFRIPLDFLLSCNSHFIIIKDFQLPIAVINSSNAISERLRYVSPIYYA